MGKILMPIYRTIIEGICVYNVLIKNISIYITFHSPDCDASLNPAQYKTFEGP